LDLQPSIPFPVFPRDYSFPSPVAAEASRGLVPDSSLVGSPSALGLLSLRSLALSEEHHGQAQAKGIAGTKQSEEGP
ncbi:unnamed protein product, partial [Urochloa humidicola]